MKLRLPAALLWAALGAGGADVAVQPIAGDFGEPRIVVRAPEDPSYQHLGWPKMAQAANGDLVLCYVAAKTHREGGAPACSVSSDQGRTFSPPRILLETAKSSDTGHTWNLALGRTPRNDLLLVAMVGDKPRTTSRPLAWRSRDHGRTWTPNGVQGLPQRAFGTFGRLFQVPGKGLALAGYAYMDEGKWQPGVWLAYSQDDGASWGQPETVSMDVRNEPAFLFTAGTIIGLVREEDPEPKTYRLFHSRDRGNTWTSGPVGFGNGSRLPSPFIAADARNPRRLLALESDRRARHIVLWAAEAGVYEWKKLGVAATFPVVERSDYSYPWMVHLDRRDWFLVFYCGLFDGPNHIWGMRITVPER